MPDGFLAATPSDSSRNDLYWFFTQEVLMPAKENMRDGRQEQDKKSIEPYKAILVDGALKDVNGNWGTLLKGVVMDSGTVRLYPVLRLPLRGNWYKGKCLLLGDSVHAMQPHAGQGVWMALEDIFLFSPLLRNARPLQIGNQSRRRL